MIRNYLRRLYRFLVPLLYSRSRFKLFLAATLGDIQLRMLTLASVTDYFSGFVRPVPVKAPFGKSVVVVAPHQDDEAIGCGGALILQLRSGGDALVVLLQDGGDEHESLGISRQEMSELRNEESRKAAAAIGMQSPRFLNYASLADSSGEAAAKVKEAILERKADAVFVPFVLDAHPDHRAANYILAEALKDVPWNVRVLGYEVWGLCIPNVMVVIDDAIEDKIRMIRCFELANRAVDYVQSTKGLNMYHSRMLGAGECRYAERFFEIPRAEYIELVGRVRAAGTPAG
jgi:LmbE family N-acetylglucosaminyl deacetylase